MSKESFVLKNIHLSDVNSDIDLGSIEGINELKEKQPELKTILSFGGYITSQHGTFSKLAADPGNRAKFAKSAWNLVNRYGFDGMNLDWEFPERTDRSNYVTLLKDLKETSNGKLLTASVSSESKKIDTVYDAEEMKLYLDLLLVMTYDFNGSWSKNIGHFAAYDIATAGMDYWANNGFPKHKLIMGIDAYARGWRAHQCVIGYHAIGASPKMPFTKEIGYASLFELKRMEGESIIETPEGPFYEVEIDGENVCYGFENKESILRKMSFVKRRGFGGAFTWKIDNDDEHFTVHRAVLEGLGIQLNNSSRKLRANSNPHKYEECVHGSWMIRDAPSGTVFNPSTGGFSQASGGGGGHYTRDASPSHQPTQSSDGFQY
ncbi:hypothetical protein PRIPAC_82853, partial [Pristionchus pacificus]